MSKLIKLTFVKTDTYLDLSYYQVKIKYWDGEEMVKHNQSSFTFGDVLIPVLKNIDKMNVKTSISINVENSDSVKDNLKHITGQITSKKTKFKSRQEITSSTEEANYIKEFVNCFNVQVL